MPTDPSTHKGEGKYRLQGWNSLERKLCELQTRDEEDAEDYASFLGIARIESFLALHPGVGDVGALEGEDEENRKKGTEDPA